MNKGIKSRSELQQALVFKILEAGNLREHIKHLEQTVIPNLELDVADFKMKKQKAEKRIKELEAIIKPLIEFWSCQPGSPPPDDKMASDLIEAYQSWKDDAIKSGKRVCEWKEDRSTSCGGIWYLDYRTMDMKYCPNCGGKIPEVDNIGT